MLTRDKLSADQWRAVRNTPHHVIVAVSATGGSPFDEMLERSAGLQGIVDAMHSTHPLVREIADSTQIMQAQDEIREWYYTLPDAQRIPSTLQQKALDSMRDAVGAVRAHGTDEDVLQYAEFVLSTAHRVATAAREGDLFGVGGQLVSVGEQEFITKLKQLSQPQQR
jgi:hypothetical protein